MSFYPSSSVGNHLTFDGHVLDKLTFGYSQKNDQSKFSYVILDDGCMFQTGLSSK